MGLGLSAHRRLHVAIVGATGAVGLELAELFVAAGHPLFAAGLPRPQVREARGREQVVVLCAPARECAQDAGGFEGIDLAFLCTPTELSRTLGPALSEFGVRVVDLSSAFRMRSDVPLVVPEINGKELDGGGRLFANPNCTTAIAALPLAVIEREFGLDEVLVVSYQAASGAGAPGLATLEWERRRDAGAPRARPGAEEPVRRDPREQRHPRDRGGRRARHQRRGAEDPGRAAEDPRRPDLVVESTTARVPVERCHSVAVHLRTKRDADPRRVRELLAGAPGVHLTGTIRTGPGRASAPAPIPCTSGESAREVAGAARYASSPSATSSARERL